LLNIPTGGGKTYILLESAIRLLKKYPDKKVFISVPNNNLVRDMFNTAIGKDFELDNVSILIGFENYIDKNRLMHYFNAGVLQEYIEEEGLIEFIDYAQNKEDVFFDDFEDKIVYKDYSNRHMVKELLKHLDKGFLKEVFESKVIITNHFYLLKKIVHDDSFNTDDYIYLFDEIHNMPDVAEATLEQSFSLYEVYTLIKAIRKDLAQMEEFKGKEAFGKNIHTLMAKAFKLQRKYINSYKTGEYTNNSLEVEPFRKEVYELFSGNLIESIKKKSHEIEKKAKYTKEFIHKIRYLVNLIGVALSSSKEEVTNVGIYYSPARGYPTIKSSKVSIEYLLHSKFWNKISYMAGVSATLSYTPKPFGKEKIYAFTRIGLYDKDKQLILETHERILDKNKVRIYETEKDMPLRESVYEPEFVGEQSNYYNYITDYIYKTFENKNSMVLCGGYQEAKFLTTLFNKKYPSINTVTANINEKTNTTLARFKEQGGILFATRNYNTGVSLDKKLLEKLYLLNFPYPIFTNIRWFSLKERKRELYYSLYANEMLIALMQTLGRLQRTKEDSGDIYILDNRYNNAKYKPLTARVKKILEYYGVIQNNQNNTKKVKNIEKKEEHSKALKKLLEVAL
jgi:Rad3-related DNA helicase